MRWVVAGGGTGGHLFPAIAVAEKLASKGRFVVLVGTGRKVEEVALRKTPFSVRIISCEGIFGRSLGGKVRALIRMVGAVRDAVGLIKETSADVVFGTGGYSSFPLVVAGRLLRKRLGLHEQNAVAGMSNRVSGRLVHRVFVSFEEASRYFPKNKVVFSGNPVRGSLFEERKREHEGRGLLVLGGSQGAKFLNDLLLSVAEELFERIPDLRIVHQAGLMDEERVRRGYARFGERVKVFSFIEDMAWAYAQADLVVSRAGATTVAELCALGKPAVFIPFPYATHAHQERNARSVEAKGGAVVLRQSEVRKDQFVELLSSLLRDEKRLSEMGKNARRLFRPGAAETIIKEMEGLSNV